MKTEPVSEEKKYDVIIPLGPTDRDKEAIPVVGDLYPKSLMTLGTRPLVWHVLRQLSGIATRLSRIHLLFHDTGDCRSGMIKAFIQDLKGGRVKGSDGKKPVIAPRLIRHVSIGKDEDLVGGLVNNRLQIQNDFILHYPDELFVPDKGQAQEGVAWFYGELLRLHEIAKEEALQSNKVYLGTITVYMQQYKLNLAAIGGLVVLKGDAIRGESLRWVESFAERPEVRILDVSSPKYARMPFAHNMGIFVFASQARPLLYKVHGDLTVALTDLVERKEGIVCAYDYGGFGGTWLHAHDQAALSAEHKDHFDTWAELARVDLPREVD